MTTLAQARAALQAAYEVNTTVAWMTAAQAFAAASKQRKPKADGRHMGKTPIPHVVRTTLADGYTVRTSCWQFKGESEADTLERHQRFTIACWRNENQPPLPARHSSDMALQAVEFIAAAETVRDDPVEWAILMEKAARNRRWLMNQCHYEKSMSKVCQLMLRGVNLDMTIAHPAVAECLIVVDGRTGYDSENPPMMVAAE